MESLGEYTNIKRIQYNGGATFVPVCQKCGRFVKPYNKIRVSEGLGLSNDKNASCSKCGPTYMIFEGFI